MGERLDYHCQTCKHPKTGAPRLIASLPFRMLFTGIVRQRPGVIDGLAYLPCPKCHKWYRYEVVAPAILLAPQDQEAA